MNDYHKSLPSLPGLGDPIITENIGRSVLHVDMCSWIRSLFGHSWPLYGWYPLHVETTKCAPSVYLVVHFLFWVFPWHTHFAYRLCDSRVPYCPRWDVLSQWVHLWCLLTLFDNKWMPMLPYSPLGHCWLTSLRSFNPPSLFRSSMPQWNTQAVVSSSSLGILGPPFDAPVRPNSLVMMLRHGRAQLDHGPHILPEGFRLPKHSFVWSRWGHYLQ